jgi:hypothetical protein
MMKTSRKILSVVIIVFVIPAFLVSQTAITIDSEVLEPNTISNLFREFNVTNANIDNTVLDEFKTNALYDSFTFLIYICSDVNGNVVDVQIFPIIPGDFSALYKREIVDKVAVALERTLMVSKLLSEEYEINVDSLSREEKLILIGQDARNNWNSKKMIYKKFNHTFLCEVYFENGTLIGMWKEFHVLRVPISKFEEQK